MKYAQLNTLTGYSFGESLIMPESYVERALQLGYEACGIADDNMYAFPSFAEAGKRRGIKTVFGLRVKLESIAIYGDRMIDLDGVLYILNEEGYLNLCRIVSKTKETVELSSLSLFRNGLALVLIGENELFSDEAFQDTFSPQIAKYRRLFGEDFYIGVSLDTEEDRNEVSRIYDFCDRNEYKTIAFPKAEYIKKTDAYYQNLLNAGVKKERMSDTVESGPNFLLSAKAVQSIYRSKDIDTTLELADKCNFSFFKERGKLITTGANDEDESLRIKAADGLKKKLGGEIPDDYMTRLTYELGVIKDMNFSAYFNVVCDYVRYAKSKDIKVGPGRGSAAGSLVSYALNITELDPIRYGLSFERFLNPKRKNMPDIDIDFQDDRREEVINYLYQKYGEKRVSDIVTFTTLKPKSAANLVAQALSVNSTHVKRLNDAISDSASTFEEAKQDAFRGYRLNKILEDPYYRDIAEKAEHLVGLPVNTSVHAAGLILSKDPIYETCPVSKKESGTVLYEYPYMERMGFLKVDILALRYLTFIKKIEDEIVKEGGFLPDIQSDLDDPETYKTLNGLDLTYIFQLESWGMRDTVTTIRPSCFSDLSAILALYRPGPKDYIPSFADRKHGKEPIEYATPLLEPILKDTYGIMIYQEQVIETVKALASFSAGDADMFRRAISKKDVSKMSVYKNQFLAGCRKNGIDNDTANKVYDDIEKFAGYGFNKSHAYSYALLSYTLLYYKTHYPEAFYKIALSENSLSSSETYNLMKELIKKQIRLRQPDINLSGEDEPVYREKRFILPLSNVTGSNSQYVKKILTERDEHGPFRSFYDFCCRVFAFTTQREEKVIISLIDSGCFDSLSLSRKSMRDELSDYLSFAKMGFDAGNIPDLKGEEDLGERYYREKSSLGLILSAKLKNIVSKPGYVTCIVSDDARLDIDSTIQVEAERSTFTIEVSGKDFKNNDFVLIKDVPSGKKRFRPSEVINTGGKKKRYE